MRKIASLTIYILSAISLILLVLYISSGTGSEGGLATSTYTGYIIAWGLGLFGLALFLLIGFSIASMIENPKILIKSLALIGAAAAIIVISYYFSSDTPLTGKNAHVSVKVLKWVGTGLNVAYFLGVFALVSVLFTEVYKAFK